MEIHLITGTGERLFCYFSVKGGGANQNGDKYFTKLAVRLKFILDDLWLLW